MNAADGNRLNYGQCDICGEPFFYGQHNVRLSIVINYTSQGYEDQFERDEITCHPACITAAKLEEYKIKAQKESDKR